jgi:exoribonuclease R
VPTSPISVIADAPAAEVARGMAAVRAELEVPDVFPAEVTAAIARAAGKTRPSDDHRADRAAVELVTIDPPGSRDLSLPLPDQVVAPGPDGDLRLGFDAPVVSEGWNAQVSLLAGIEAAGIMVEGGAGLLRTLPSAEERTLARLRRSATALGVAWPAEGGYPAFVRSLDPATPSGAALLVQATRVLRGAGYVGFRDGAMPAEHAHAAVAAPYAHVTAPLRRLCDRAANEVVLALFEGRSVPDWAAAEVEVLPEVMAEAVRRESAYNRAALDLVEALVLRTAVGHRFPAVVVDVDDDRAQVQLRDPAVVARARYDGGCAPGDEVDVVVRAADPMARRIDLEVV